MEFEPGDYYIDKLTIQTGCHLTVMPPSAGNGSRSDVNFYLNQAFTLNAGPTCWNMSPGTCNSNIGIPEIQAQHPERLKLFVYQGDFTTYQGAKLAAGLYVAQGTANFVGAGNSAFIGEIYANTISTANGGPTAYAYRPVFTAPPPPTPPVVSLQPTPPGVTYIAPATITLAATANANGANNAITLVQFFQGSSLIGSTTTPTSPNGNSYSIVWDKVPANTYSITAKATDSAGNTSTSSPLIINVINNKPPVISLTASPLNSAAPASITLTANASDSDGTISKVDFFNGTTNIASLTQPPFTTQWNNVPAGSYTLTATATDNLGASTISSPVTITVTSHVAKVFDIHTDHLNTPSVITDSNGNPVWRWDSAPFGETLPDENPQKTGSTRNFVFNLRFAGQYFDRETNLHYNYFRDYDPQTRRYIQSDPIGLYGGINTYAYSLQNPKSYVDPLGLDVVLNNADRAAGLQPNRPKKEVCESDCRKCKEKWFKDNYGNLVGGMVGEFSFFSYVSPDRALGAFGLTGVGVTTKVGVVKGVSSVSGYIAGSEAMAAAAGTITAKSLGVTFGAFAPAFATTAELLASRACGCSVLD
jgi:RHS repeat-associated protein